MKNHYDKDIRKYMQATKRLLICPKEYRKQFIEDMERDLNQLIQENTSADISDIIDYFGTPAELAQTYLDNIPKEELADYKIKRKFYFSITGIILLALFIGIIVFYTIKLYESHELEKVYIYESIEILEEDIEK